MTSTPVSARPQPDLQVTEDPVAPLRVLPTPRARVPAAPAAASTLDVRAVLLATAWWALATLAGLAVVAYLVGPLLAAREQRTLLTELRQDVSQAVGSVNDSLLGSAPVTRSPALGAPVALLQVQRLGLQEVLVEGADPGRTRTAPGHVPGTAGLGQPGNSVVAGRHALYGRSFADLSDLRTGDQLVATTVQGQSLYVVTTVQRDVPVRDRVADASTADQLTLLTSSSRLPWASDRGTVVVATLATRPFSPTPQNGRSAGQSGRSHDSSALALVVLCGLAYTATAAATTVLYRRWSGLGTYVATTPALVALLVFTALAASSLLPAWA